MCKQKNKQRTRVALNRGNKNLLQGVRNKGLGTVTTLSTEQENSRQGGQNHDSNYNVLHTIHFFFKSHIGLVVIIETLFLQITLLNDSS